MRYLRFPFSTDYSPKWFAIWRFIFGVYLAYYFFMTIPYAPELYSSKGVLPNPALNPTYFYFPNLLNHFSSPAFVESYVAILAFLSVLLMFGVFRRTNAFLLWYGFASLYNRNLLTLDPSTAFVGWLLLALVFIPAGEPNVVTSGRGRENVWFMPSTIYWGALILLGLGYTWSGISKFLSPSWYNGTALMHVLRSPISYHNFFTETVLKLPPSLLAFFTWFLMITFMLSLPLLIWSKARPWMWLLLTAMFISMFFFLNLGEVIWGMIIFHLFVLKPAWFRDIFAGAIKYIKTWLNTNGSSAIR